MMPRIVLVWHEHSGDLHLKLCDKKVTPKSKGKFYNLVLRSALSYKTECWPVKHNKFWSLIT